MKKLLSIVLCVSMIFTTSSLAFATDTAVDAEPCMECGVAGAHMDTCSLYVTEEQPVEGEEMEFADEVTEPIGPQIGDQIWIKSGSSVYKDLADETGWSLLSNYYVAITDIVNDENGIPVWYEFKFTKLGIGEVLLWQYKYVKVEDTSAEAPSVDVPEIMKCSCGESVLTNLAYHADSCARKQYVKSLFEDQTASELYAEWHKYEEAVQEAILSMLEMWDSEKFEELTELLNKIFEDSGFDIDWVQYEDMAESGIRAIISAIKGAFPEGTAVTLTDTEIAQSDVEAVVAETVDGDILGISAVDISFDGQQPTQDVSVSMTLPQEEIPDEANMVVIVHIGNDGPEVVGSKYIDTLDGDQIVSFSTGGFSSYVAVYVNGKYNAKKMRTVLEGNEKYEIADFKIDLFDYDPVKMNNALNAATSDGNGFHLTGYGITGMGSNNGINNSASTHAKQGILQNTLQGEDKLPVINYLAGTDAGKKTGEILFSDDYQVDGKTIYDDIPFEMIYDKETGYYEYKSSVNHAQLNRETNRIELYADTLSVENSHVAAIDLSTATGMSDFTATTISKESFKGTAKNGQTEGDAAKRIDSYVVFTADDVDASTVGQIYVKAKVPASVGQNEFQLFFTTDQSKNWEEPKSFGNPNYSKKITYTPNGDWIEFVIDTSENSNWKDKITAIRVDLFDSNKGSVDVTGSYPIEISEIKFIRKDYDAYATRGGFYPFSEIQDSYPGNNTAFSYERWETMFENDGLSMDRASRSIFNPAPATEALRYEELAFGTVIEFDFYLPVDKTSVDKKDLTYYFNGDDDLWVFVDDKLVLDIGGGHGAITGILNFSDGTWEVESANTVTGYNSGADAAYGKKSGNLDALTQSAGRHTMKIFYLERGGSVSNCFMKYNLPRTPQGSVVVSNDVVEKNGANTDVLLTERFEYNISIKNNGTGDYQELTPLGNADYYLVKADGTTAEMKTDANGNFTLASNEEAVFNIDENFNVTITETKKTIKDHKWISTVVNGSDAFAATQLTADRQTKTFAFVNTYERLFGDLKISKTGISDIDNNKTDEVQSTIYTVEGKSNNGETISLEVVIVGNSDITIRHIPIGTYKVKEKEDWSWRYIIASNEREVTIIAGRVVETSFANERDNVSWFSGDSYCSNWWGGSNGTALIRREDE